MNSVAYSVGETVQSNGAVKTLNDAAYKVGQTVAPAASTFASGFQAMGQAWFGTSYYYDYYGYQYNSYDDSYYYDEYYSYGQWWDDELEEDFADEWSWDEDFWKDYAETYFGEDQDYFWKEASDLKIHDFEFDYIMPYDDWDYLSYFEAESGLAPGVVPYALRQGSAPYNEWAFDDDDFEMVLEDNQFWPDFNDPDELDEFHDWSRDWQMGKEQSNFNDLARFDNDLYFQLNDDGYDYEMLFWGDQTAGGEGGNRRSLVQQAAADAEGADARNSRREDGGGALAQLRAQRRLRAARKAADRASIADLIAFEEGLAELDAAHAQVTRTHEQEHQQQQQSGEMREAEHGHDPERTHELAHGEGVGKHTRRAARKVLQ